MWEAWGFSYALPLTINTTNAFQLRGVANTPCCKESASRCKGVVDGYALLYVGE